MKQPVAGFVHGLLHFDVVSTIVSFAYNYGANARNGLDSKLKQKPILSSQTQNEAANFPSIVVSLSIIFVVPNSVTKDLLFDFYVFLIELVSM